MGSEGGSTSSSARQQKTNKESSKPLTRSKKEKQVSISQSSSMDSVFIEEQRVVGVSRQNSSFMIPRSIGERTKLPLRKARSAQTTVQDFSI